MTTPYARREADQADTAGGDQSEGDHSEADQSEVAWSSSSRSGTAGAGRGRRSGGAGARRSPADRDAARVVSAAAAAAEVADDPEAVARAVCLRQLTLGPRTRAQLAEALRKKHVPADAAERVLDRFGEVGLIDDEAFAAAWVSSRHGGQGLGRRALASELHRRGVHRDTIGEAVAVVDADAEKAAARALVDRKVGATAGLPAATRVRRLVGMLARKGYGAGLAGAVVREALAAERDEADRDGRPDPGADQLDAALAQVVADGD